MAISARRPSLDDNAANALVLAETAGGVTTLTLNRPAKFNALSEEMLAALDAELRAVADDEAVRCVILAGAGKAFCAGHDLTEMRENREESYFRALFARCSRVMQSIRAVPVPVIARVQGIATAAGCQLVAACDLAVAATGARFAVSGIDVGLFCSTPAVALSRNVPTKAAFDMLVTGRFIDAPRAMALGLVNAVVDEDRLREEVQHYAEAICTKSPAAVRLGKRMFYEQAAMDLPDAYAFAGNVMAGNMMFADTRDGIDAFLAKRHGRTAA